MLAARLNNVLSINKLINCWKNTPTHKKIWGLALPMVLSNLSVPLVALVDTMVIGRLPDAHNMAAVALGSSIYTLLIGCLSFLRMGTTGFTAQAVGQQNGSLLRQILLQSVLLAIGLALLLILLAVPVSHLALYWVQPTHTLSQTTELFLSWRLAGLPAALLNYTLVGWFLGNQNARIPLIILITTNIINMLLSIWFVLYLDRGVSGAAQAAVIAEWSGCVVGSCLIYTSLKNYHGQWLFTAIKQWSTWKPLLTVNRDIFIRSLTLQAVFFLLTLQGTKLGENTVAANVLILNGLVITAYVLDGLAHAIEALCGRAIGAKDNSALYQILLIASSWALLVSLVFAVSFGLLGHYFINLQTTIESVRLQAYPLIPYLALLPLIAVWSYLLDGLFIGATRAKEMRNAMLLAFFISLPVAIILQPLANNGLWISFLIFMALRGIILGYMGWRLLQHKANLWDEKKG